MKIRFSWAILIALVVFWPATSAQPGVGLIPPQQLASASSSSVPSAGGLVTSNSALLHSLGEHRNTLYQASVFGPGAVGPAEAFSGSSCVFSSGASLLYSGVTVSLPHPDASLLAQLNSFDIVMRDLNTGNEYSILSLFTTLTLVPGGTAENPIVTAILSTPEFPEQLLAESAASAGGKFEVKTQVVHKSGSVSADHYNLISNWDEPEGVILFEQKTVMAPFTGLPQGVSLNYLAGPGSVRGFPPVEESRLKLTIVGTDGPPDEDGSYLVSVVDSKCEEKPKQKCAAQLFPPGTQIRIYSY